MKCMVNEVAEDIYRLSTFHDGYGMTFNQFLIADDEPVLIHTGFRAMFDITRAGIASVIDPATLRWVGFSHFESDECGALNHFLSAAPESQAICSTVGAIVSLGDFADRPARGLEDGEVLPTGKHRLRFLATPHVPHGWDAGLFFDEVTGTLFCSDLFFHAGQPETMIESGVVDRARDAMVAGVHSPLAKDLPYTPYTRSTLERLAMLDATTLALMHGSTYQGNGREAVLALADVIESVHGAAGQ